MGNDWVGSQQNSAFGEKMVFESRGYAQSPLKQIFVPEALFWYEKHFHYSSLWWQSCAGLGTDSIQITDSCLEWKLVSVNLHSKKAEAKERKKKDPGPGNHCHLIPPLAGDKTRAFQCSVISCIDLERDFSIHWAVNLLFYIYYMMYKDWISSRENMPCRARSLGRNLVSG